MPRRAPRKSYHRPGAEKIARRRAWVRHCYRLGMSVKEIHRTLQAQEPALLAGSAAPYALIWEDLALMKREQTAAMAAELADVMGYHLGRAGRRPSSRMAGRLRDYAAAAVKGPGLRLRPVPDFGLGGAGLSLEGPGIALDR